MKARATILCENTVGVPFGVIGGTHLGFSSDLQFEKTIEAIENYRIDKIGVSHCTGLDRAAMLQARLGKRFFFGSVGSFVDAQ